MRREWSHAQRATTTSFLDSRLRRSRMATIVNIVNQTHTVTLYPENIMSPHSAPKPPKLDSATAIRTASLRRRESEKLGVRRAILAAAGELLLESGYAAFSMRKLAERIGYTPTTVYRYFRDKDALLMTVVGDGFVMFEEKLRQAIYGELDPFAQLTTLGRAYVRFGLEHPVHYRVMFMERADFWTTMPADFCEPMMASFEVLRAIVARAIATGETSQTHAETVSHAIWAQVHGVVALALTMPFMDEAQVQQMAESGMALVLEGLRKRI